MTSHDYSPKKQTEHQTRPSSQEEQLPEADNLHGLKSAIQKPTQANLTPPTLLHLQRLIGNKAVMQLVRQTHAAHNTTPTRQSPLITIANQPSQLQSTIQTRRFANDGEAITWLVQQGIAFIGQKRGINPNNFNRANMETYLTQLETYFNNYEKMESFLRTHGGAYAEDEHFRSNLNSQLVTPNVISQAMAQIRSHEVEHHFGAKNRTVNATAQEHIFLGTVDNPANPTSVTGYHWEGDDNAVAEAFGAKQNEEPNFGLYQKSVRARGHPTVVKGNVSTFFPETWSRADILEAIEYANVTGGRLEAQTPSKARGLMMVINDAGFFPDAPENQA